MNQRTEQETKGKGKEEGTEGTIEHETSNEKQTDDTQQYYKPNLPTGIYKLVVKIFGLLDKKGKGYLTVKDFVRLGYAMTEERPTIAAAEFMLEQANSSGSGRVDRDEFMGYCDRLQPMPEDLLSVQLNAFVHRLERNNAVELAELQRVALKSVSLDDV